MAITTLVPQHILSAINQIEADISKKNYNDTVADILQLKEKIRHLSNSIPEYAYPGIFSALGEILDLADLCDVSHHTHFVDIDNELALALNYAMDIHPRMRTEIRTVFSVLENPISSGFSQSEDYFDFKYFKLVSSKKIWKQKMANSNAEVLCPSFKHLLIGMVNEDRYIYSLPLSIQNIYNTFREQERKMFEKWFMLGRTLTLYIYVPK